MRNELRFAALFFHLLVEESYSSDRHELFSVRRTSVRRFLSVDLCPSNSCPSNFCQSISVRRISVGRIPVVRNSVRRFLSVDFYTSNFCSSNFCWSNSICRISVGRFLSVDLANEILTATTMFSTSPKSMQHRPTDDRQTK